MPISDAEYGFFETAPPFSFAALNETPRYPHELVCDGQSASPSASAAASASSFVNWTSSAFASTNASLSAAAFDPSLPSSRATASAASSADLKLPITLLPPARITLADHSPR